MVENHVQENKSPAPWTTKKITFMHEKQWRVSLFAVNTFSSGVYHAKPVVLERWDRVYLEENVISSAIFKYQMKLCHSKVVSAAISYYQSLMFI